MKISNIGLNYVKNNQRQNDSIFVEKITKNKNAANITDLNKFYSSQIFFSGNTRDYKTVKDYNKLSKTFTRETEEVLEKAAVVAARTGSKEVKSEHILFATLLKLREFIDGLDDGTINYEQNTRYVFPNELEMLIGSGKSRIPIFNDKETRKRIRKVINKHLKQMQDTFDIKKDDSIKRKPYFKTPMSKEAMKSLIETFSIIQEDDSTTNLFMDSFLHLAACYSKNKKIVNQAVMFRYDLKKIVDIEKNEKFKNHLDFYNNKADILWQNIDAGKNVAVLCDTKDYSQIAHLKSSFINLIQQDGVKYKNIDPEKTDIIALNEYADMSFLVDLIKNCKKNKDRTSVIFMDLRFLITNSGTALTTDEIKAIANNDKDCKNIKIILSMNPESFYANAKKGSILSEALSEYACQTLPALNAQDAIKYLTNENGVKYIEDVLKKKTDTQAIKKAVELTAYDEGNYPDKAVSLLKSTSSFNSEAKIITAEMIEDYIEKTKKLSENQQINSDNHIIFNTQKTLQDIVGTPMTKAEATNIVNQIKNGTFKTKGYVIYQSNGSSYGGGRKNTAFSIAGEAGIPVVTVNAKDFALKDIDMLYQNSDFSEMKIKKIISSAKAQAETNPSNTAMLYIENFDNFGSNPMYGFCGPYEQKAFSQLLDEMDSIKKEGSSNLLIVGSVNIPNIIDENIMKPNRFLNSIVVYPPNTIEETKEVFNYYINKMNLEIEGKTKEEKDKIIDGIAQTAQGFSVVDIMYILETAKNVMQERNKKAVDLSDLTEAYLQTTTGRSAGCDLNVHGKNIVTSHEAGHAIVSQIMEETAKKHGKNWQYPDRINFMTLDPRGYYGGAVFYKESENHQFSFEKMLADIVSSYGGHSAEKLIYNIKGSLGITADMKQASRLANHAVLDMGMGAKTGVRHIPKDALGQPNVSEKKMGQIEDDIDLILSSAMQISDEIVETYKDFILEFTKKHSKDVGTGSCLISSEQFIKELNDWRSKQDDKTKEKFKTLESRIMSIQSKVQEKK